MNTLAIVYMKMNNYTTAIEFNEKQLELSSERNKFISMINISKCYSKLDENVKSMEYLSRAKYLAQK